MRIGIVEISESHEECIYTQLKFLTDAGHVVDLILNPCLKNQVTPYKSLSNSIEYILPVKNGMGKKLKQQYKLSKLLNSYDLVIYNTASSSKLIRNVSLLSAFSKVPTVGLLHNTLRLQSSFTQKLISIKIKKYFVLSDFLANTAIKKKGIVVSSFYPIFFQETQNSITKPKDTIWISIPGRIDLGRRDYKSLFDSLNKIESLERIQFLILGKLNKQSKEGGLLWNLITESGFQDNFIWFDNFIPNKDYHGYLKASDYIMPLLKNDVNYLKHKISGSFNLAFAYKKPLISKAFFKTIPDLNKNSFFYENNTLSSFLQALDSGDLIAKQSYNDAKWSYEYQKEKYLNFLNIKAT